MRKYIAQLGGILLLLAASLSATIFSSITGLIHDPQHRPVQGARVTLAATNSDWSRTMTSNEAGEFRFDNVPRGAYTVKVEGVGFAAQTQDLTLASGAEA